MSLKKHITLLSLALFASSATTFSQTNSTKSNGYVNFNLGTSSIEDNSTQTLSLFGCNTVLADTSKLWHGPTTGFVWDSTNQVLSDVPYGQKLDPITGKYYYVSKYYIASPPVFQKNAAGGIDSNTIYDIGIITPDQFTFNGDKPVQRVFLNYNILEPTQIEYIPVVFDTSFEKVAKRLQYKINVDYVPFKVECADFRWKDTVGIVGASGASGIGSFHRNASDTARLFLPYLKLSKKQTTKEYLDCKVTILNDILLHYEVFFVVKGQSTQSIDLREHVLKHPNEPITFHCEYREELPCGCVKPEAAEPYGEE